MKMFFIFVMLGSLSSSVFAQNSDVGQIQNLFARSKDYTRAQSFKILAGKKYQCVEYEFNERTNVYMKYTTRVSFKNTPRNYYGGGATLDYLEYDEYRRIDQDKYSQVPRFGCDGIEWGVAYLDESPHLQMSNSVAIGKSNLGPCYSLDFRIPGTSGLVAVGTYGNRVIHALNCQSL